ncbi:Antitoxin (modular protein) [uncultured Gammaproteobacteria bacterium]
MAKVDAITARAKFSELVNRAAYGQERVVLTRHGKPIAAVVSLADLEALERLEDDRDAGLGAAALKEWQSEGQPTIPWSTVKAESGL